MIWLLRQTQGDPLLAVNLDGARHHPVHQTIEISRNKYLLGKNKRPVFRVVKKWRQVRCIVPSKGKQKETKERNHENETTSPENVKCWKITLSGLETCSPAVMYTRMKPNKRYKPGN